MCKDNSIPLSEFISKQVAGMEKVIENYEHILGEVLATLKVNMERGSLKVVGEGTEEIFIQLIANWEKQYKLLKGK